jgi:uncharacterized protein (TIGR00255 family)
MIQSMTGFGKAECVLPDKKLTIEIRSLNSKQIDISARLPAFYKEKEPEIRQAVASRLERGKIECIFYYELIDDALPGLINETVVKRYYEQLRNVSGELGLEAGPELLSAVMRLPDVIRNEKPTVQEVEWQEVRGRLLEALDQVSQFRIQEGNAIEKDLQEHVKVISGKLSKVENYEAERILRIRERIGNNLLAFLAKEEIDENRFEQELILYLEKFDISEEKARLRNHCDYFKETIKEQGPVGRKLGFISQEMGREINTLGSKANHSEIQRLVVEMKDELEQIREQILNVL